MANSDRTVRRVEDEIQEAHKISCCMKTSSGKMQTLPWITFVLQSFHWKTGIINLQHLTSLSNIDTSYQTLSVHSGRADNGTGQGMMVTSCQAFFRLKQCLSHCAVFFPCILSWYFQRSVFSLTSLLLNFKI